MGRDHSYECTTCGEMRSGLNDLRCDYDPCMDCGEMAMPCLCLRTVFMRERLEALASNLATAAGLCAAFEQGYEQREHERLYSDHGYRMEQDWRPGYALPATSGDRLSGRRGR